MLVEPPNGKQWLCGLAEGESLFVRECYELFYDEALQKMGEDRMPQCPGLIYTGNPGIGKSSWLNYALVRFLQAGYAVVLERAKAGDYFVFQDGACKRWKRRRPDLDGLPDNAVYLFDPDERDSEALQSNVFTIVATSPQEKHYKALRKLVNSSVRYFPCWSLEELRAAKRDAPEVLRTVEDRFMLWGGIPRYIFDSDQSKWTGKLASFINDFDVKKVETYRGHPEISEEHQKSISHMVVQYRIIGDDFSKCELDFASAEIARRVVEVKAEQGYEGLIAHYEYVRRQKWQGAYAGHLWEHLCHKILPLGGQGWPFVGAARKGHEE